MLLHHNYFRSVNSFLKHNVSSSILRWFLINMLSPQGLTMLQIFFFCFSINMEWTQQQKRISAKQPMHNFSWLASDFHDFNQEKWQLLTGIWKKWHIPFSRMQFLDVYVIFLPSGVTCIPSTYFYSPGNSQEWLWKRPSRPA